MKTENFTVYMNRVIRTLEKEERYGTAYIYGYALSALQYFWGKETEIPFTIFQKTYTIKSRRYE